MRACTSAGVCWVKGWHPMSSASSPNILLRVHDHDSEKIRMYDIHRGRLC